MQLEYIALIINYIHFSGLLDYVYFATKQPLKPTSIHVQQMPFYKTSDLQALSQNRFCWTSSEVRWVRSLTAN